ncbi:uncharacterized protein LOC141906816 [Tubulanus polymorphus]|uniref:uncharacterized protein LOC141906816 n=1 Tax=Tubulanus polymorphus TaxID=672921 RepID=UPI003DA68B76
MTSSVQVTTGEEEPGVVESTLESESKLTPEEEETEETEEMKVMKCSPADHEKLCEQFQKLTTNTDASLDPEPSNNDCRTIEVKAITVITEDAPVIYNAVVTKVKPVAEGDDESIVGLCGEFEAKMKTDEDFQPKGRLGDGANIEATERLPPGKGTHYEAMLPLNRKVPEKSKNRKMIATDSGQQKAVAYDNGTMPLKLTRTNQEPVENEEPREIITDLSPWLQFDNSVPFTSSSSSNNACMYPGQPQYCNISRFNAVAELTIPTIGAQKLAPIESIFSTEYQQQPQQTADEYLSTHSPSSDDQGYSSPSSSHGNVNSPLSDAAIIEDDDKQILELVKEMTAKNDSWFFNMTTSTSGGQTAAAITQQIPTVSNTVVRPTYNQQPLRATVDYNHLITQQSCATYPYTAAAGTIYCQQQPTNNYTMENRPMPYFNVNNSNQLGVMQQQQQQQQYTMNMMGPRPPPPPYPTNSIVTSTIGGSGGSMITYNQIPETVQLLTNNLTQQPPITMTTPIQQTPVSTTAMTGQMVNVPVNMVVQVQQQQQQQQRQASANGKTTKKNHHSSSKLTSLPPIAPKPNPQITSEQKMYQQQQHQQQMYQQQNNGVCYGAEFKKPFPVKPTPKLNIATTTTTTSTQNVAKLPTPPTMPEIILTKLDLARAQVAKMSMERMIEPDSEGEWTIHGIIDSEEVLFLQAYLERLRRIDQKMPGIEAKILSAKSDDFTPLHLAVLMYNNCDMVRLLLEYGASPNELIRVRDACGNGHWKRLLHVAASGGLEWFPVLQVLAKFQGTNKEEKDSHGLTALHCAIKEHAQPKTDRKTGREILNDSTPTVCMLLNCGASAFQKDDKSGQTAIHFAVATQDYRLVHEVLRITPNIAEVINIPRMDKNTPLHLVAGMEFRTPDEHVHMVQMLLHYGAERECKNQEGKYPYQVAKGNQQIETLLNLKNR